MEVVIINADDWQWIYLDGYLHDEAHELGEGNHFYYLLNLSNKYQFNSDDVEVYLTNKKGDEYLSTYGSFPHELESFKGMYE